MSWNYRVMKRTYKGMNYEEDAYDIYEVYYNDNGEVKNWSESPTYPHGETLEELKEDIKRYEEALNKPVLDYDELEKKFEKEECSD